MALREILREQRIERIRLLLDRKEHPERHPGPFSAANISYVLVVFTASALTAGVVGAAFGRWAPPLLVSLVAALAIGVVQDALNRAYRRYVLGVIRFWRLTGMVAVGLVSAYVVLKAVAPDSAPARRVEAAGSGVLERQRARIDRRQRLRRYEVPAGQAEGDGWRLLADSGYARLGTLAEAMAWCAELGPEWRLPDLEGWPPFARWPRLPRTFYVWTRTGQGATIGTGEKPGAFVTGGNRPTDSRGVFCIREVAP